MELGFKKVLALGCSNGLTEPTNHANDCYFCKVTIKVYNKGNKHLIAYPHPLSVSLPAPHSDDIFVPHPPASLTEHVSSSSSSKNSVVDEDFIVEIPNAPQLLAQEDLDDLVRYSERFRFERLQERNLLMPNTT